MVNSSGISGKSPTPPGVRTANPVPPVRKNHQMMNGAAKKGQPNKGQIQNQKQSKVSPSRRPVSPAPQSVVQAQEGTSNPSPKPTPQTNNTKAAAPVIEVQPQQPGSQKQPMLKPEQLVQKQSKAAGQTHDKQATAESQAPQPQAKPSQQLNPQRQPLHQNSQSDPQSQPQSTQQQKPNPSPQPQTQAGQQHSPQILGTKQQEKLLNEHQQKIISSQQRMEQNEGKLESQAPQQPTALKMPQQRQQANQSQQLIQPQQLQLSQQSLIAQSSQRSQPALLTQHSQEVPNNPSTPNTLPTLQNVHPTSRPSPMSDTHGSTSSLTSTQHSPLQSPLQSPEIFLQPSDAQQQILQRQRQLRPAPKPSINGVVLDQPVQVNSSKDESNLNPFLKQQMVKSPNSGRRVVLVRKVKQLPDQSLSEESSMQSCPAPAPGPGFVSGQAGLRKRSFGGFQPRDQAKQILGQHINRRLSQTQTPGVASHPNLTTSQGDLDESHSRGGDPANNLVTMADFSVSTPENLASVKEAFPTTLASTQSTQRKQTTSQLSLPSQTRFVSPFAPSLQTSVTSPTSITAQVSGPRRPTPQCENFSASLGHVALPAEAISEVANSAAIRYESPAKVVTRAISADDASSATKGSVLKCDAIRSQVFSPQYRKNKSIAQLESSSSHTPEPSVTNAISNPLGEGRTTVKVPCPESTTDHVGGRTILPDVKNGAPEPKGVSANTTSPVVVGGDKNGILASAKEPLASETDSISPASCVGANKRIERTKEAISQPQRADAVPSLSQETRNEHITVDKMDGELSPDTSFSPAAPDKQAAEAGKEVRDDGVSIKQKRFNEMKSYKIGEKCRLQVEARAETLQKEQSAATADEQQPALSSAAQSGEPQAITTATQLKNDSCLDRNNNDNVEEMFRKMYGKELASLQAKYEAQLEALSASLARKEEELVRTRSEACEALARSREEQQQIQSRLTKEKQEIEEKHRKEREAREREEKERREREEKERREREEKERKEREEKEKTECEERERREAEEKSKKEEEEEDAERKRKNENSKKKSSESEGTEEDEDGEETEAESNKRKIEKMQMEMLLLKQQNEEFEEMVREKYRRQVELELQIGEISNEVTQKEAAIQSVRVELSYAKNETALTRARVQQLEAEVAEHKLRVEALEQELDTAERELKRMEILQEKLRVTESKRNELQAQIDEIELERDEEIKIIQDALDEAAQEREELLSTFEKEIEKLNSLNTAREAQMLQEFEDKLKELEQQHKSKLEEKEREAKTALQRSKRLADEEDVRQRLERLRSDLTSEWEDKLRSECSRLKGELDSLHAEEKHLAVESIRVQKEQELQEVRKGVDGKVETLNKEISELKQSLVSKDEFYQQEIDEIRTRADRDVWELRRKLQKLDESSYDRQQLMEDKHREDLERLREEYADKMAGLEAQLSCVDVRGMTDLRAKLEAVHKQQMEHLGEQHRLSMERLRDELEAEKEQAAEEARVIVSKHHEYINDSLKEQLAELVTSNTQYREEIEAIKFALSRREEVIKSLEEEIAKLRASKGSSPTTPFTHGSPTAGSPPPTAGSPTGGSTASSSSFPFPHEGSQGSRSSQDRLSNDADEDGHKGSGLLGKVFGGGWFSGTRARDSSTPSSGSPSGGSSKKNRQST